MTTSGRPTSSQFIVVWSNPGNEDLLKAEVSVRFKHWSPSFSCKGLMSFKNIGDPLTPQQASGLNLAFARRLGIFQQKLESRDWQQMIQQNTLPLQCYLPEGKKESPFSGHGDRPQCQLSDSGLSWLQGETLQAVFLGKEIWLINCFISDEQLGTPGAMLPMDENDAPSRAYFKMAQSLKLREHDWQHVIELGASPGGITQALLEQGMHVDSVDSGAMADTDFFRQALQKKQLTHHPLSVQQFLEKRLHLNATIDAIVSDMNLTCEQNLHFSLEVARFYRARELWLTLKMPVPKLAHKLSLLERLVRQWGARTVHWCQLPAHRRETLLIASR